MTSSNGTYFVCLSAIYVHDYVGRRHEECCLIW
jgi:hypothetical protein